MYQFARDAAVAEAWLMAQDPYLKSEELGQTIDEVENLIKKHEAFEKAAAAQEERFAALERLTTVSLLSKKCAQCSKFRKKVQFFAEVTTDCLKWLKYTFFEFFLNKTAPKGHALEE